ncbi:MAK10-like protein [Tanacetum coccineum]
MLKSYGQRGTSSFWHQLHGEYFVNHSPVNHALETRNPYPTLCEDYSIPSHEGYRNTIELPEGNNVVPLRSDTIRLVQNGCLFYRLRSEDPNQHLKDFLKLVDSLDLDVANRERTRMHLFQFFLCDQASNWLERLSAGSISIWEDLTNRFLAQFFPPRRTAKLHNDIMMFQQHQGEFDSEAWTRFKDLLQKAPHHGIDLWLQDLALYDNESWNDPKDFAKPVKAISLPQDIPMVHTTLNTTWKIPNKLSSIMHPRISTKWEAHGQTFINPWNGSFSTYSSSYQIKLEKALIDFDSHQERRLSSLEAQLGQQQDDMVSKINLLWKAVSEKLDDTPTRNTAGNPTAQMNFASTNYLTKEELRGKGIKSPSKLLSLKYLSQSSLDDEAKESAKSRATEYKDHEMTVEREEEFKEETEEETKEE